MKLGEIIKSYREIHNLSQREFAKISDISHSYIAMLERDLRYSTNTKISPTLDALNKIAGAMGMELDILLAKMDDTYISFKDTPHFNSIPLVGIVKAGYDYLAEQNIVGYVDCDIKDKENCFALKVKGDSMQPILYEGDIIIVRKQSDIESGQVAVVLIGNECTVKKVIKHDSSIELVAFNSYYPPRTLEKDFIIIGKVIEGHIRKVFE